MTSGPGVEANGVTPRASTWLISWWFDRRKARILAKVAGTVMIDVAGTTGLIWAKRDLLRRLYSRKTTGESSPDTELTDTRQSDYRTRSSSALETYWRINPTRSIVGRAPPCGQ